MPMMQSVSPRAQKVLEAMKSAGLTSEAKMTDADHITKLLKMPKGQVAEALHELMEKKIVKRHADTKAARYFVLPPTPELQYGS